MRFLLVLCALLLSACATLPSDAPPYARAPDPPAGLSNVYVYRLGAYPVLRSPMIRIDGNAILSAPERSYTVIPLEPGAHEFQLEWSWDTGTPNLRFPFKVLEGAPLYLKISGSFEGGYPGFVIGVSVEAIGQARAEAELTRCCRYMSPRAND
jgi:hypothetical protein